MHLVENDLVLVGVWASGSGKSSILRGKNDWAMSHSDTSENTESREITRLNNLYPFTLVGLNGIKPSRLDKVLKSVCRVKYRIS